MTSTVSERALREHLTRLQKELREGDAMLGIIDEVMGKLQHRIDPAARIEWEGAVLERRYAALRRRSLDLYIEQVEHELALAQAGEAVA